jgi:L-asparaginase/Glu-tRNA(Gln) amidotransferase subunit D
MDRKVLEHLLDHLVGGDHLRGVIFQAFGAGDVGTYLHPVFVYLREAKIPVLITTQAADGVSSCDVNAPGRLLRQRALAIPAYDMSLECTTTKLMWLLGQKLGYDEICSRMLEDLHGEISLAER